LNTLPPVPGETLPGVTLPLALRAVAASRNVGRLFPLITPSPVPAPSAGVGSGFPVITPSPAATSSVAPPGRGQVRPGSPGQDQGLALSEPLAGSGQAGLVLMLLAVAGAAGWLLLGRASKRRVPFTPSPVPAASPGIGAQIPVIAPPPAATSVPAPRPGRTPPAAPGRGLAPGEPLAGSRQAGLVLALLAVAGAAGWLLLGRARKRRVP